ncbi:uncharacterized protein FOMMEDRAFT_157715 [Fomitiporia mediterranea MF3/22]|uniref:uncharacterized protein n=1 Tax=Fomitiporia mediterranea (strain MF3/22) TaxID=694068 RepID=UPI0004407C8E|nr:uncharacterized protein FOMMEDRAFT_157715 [Fomitiporia mediterranea MF3/22]EJD02492.1 hypothetical protein FOMMEDRAFT_157715 [Fomitiporia mediterranea MF3/22]
MTHSVSLYVVILTVPAVVVLWRFLGRWLHVYFTRKMTALYDIPNIGRPRANEKRLQGTAVVCGGSIAGLWAARICADHFEEVAIVEPEAWVATNEGTSDIYDEKGHRLENRGLYTRTRVQQYRSQHSFQPITLVALRQLFPSIDDEIRHVDGRISDANYNLQVYGKFIGIPRTVHPDASYSQTFFVTRETYERLLRRLVLAYSSRIRWVVGTAIGVSPDEKDLTTLKYVTIRTEYGDEESIPASLVVDCSGTSQAGIKWLKRIYTDPKYTSVLQCTPDIPRGVPAFDENLKIEYNAKQRFVKFRVFVPPEFRFRLPIPNGYDNAAWMFTYMPRPGLERKFLMLERMEGHRIEMAFGGWGDPPLPESLSDVKEWLLSMETDKPIPDWIHDLVNVLLEINGDHEKEVGRYPNNYWIRYERAPYIPSNFVAIGDAVMHVNPAFGQGCQKAAIGAISLDNMLRRPSLLNSISIPRGFGRCFFEFHSPRIAGAWDGTKPTDYQWDTTTPVKGEKLSDEKFNGKVGALMMKLAGMDQSVSDAIWHVRVFLAPPTDLMHPTILAKLAWLHIRQKLGLA